jgi:hypothetical protein
VSLGHNAPRRGAGAVERGGLENRWACKRLVGSNPTPAVRHKAETCIKRVFWSLGGKPSERLKTRETAGMWRELALNWRAAHALAKAARTKLSRAKGSRQ